ncbi:MAG: hypothetical protein AB1861_14960 [Cyanobacteriota bacterium]
MEVTQGFENPFPTTLSAFYIFAHPDEIAVDDMLIRKERSHSKEA